MMNKPQLRYFSLPAVLRAAFCIALFAPIGPVRAQVQAPVGQAYGQRWVRLLAPRQGKQAPRALTLKGKAATGQWPTLAAPDYTDAGQLWCMVEEKKGRFRLQNRAAGGSYALTVVREGKKPVGVALVPAARAALWTWQSDATGGRLVAAMNKKDTLCLWHTGARGDSAALGRSVAAPEAQWAVADASRTLLLDVAVTGRLPLQLQDYVAEVDLTYADAPASPALHLELTRSDIGRPQTFFLPLDKVVTATCTYPSRGYRFEAWRADGTLSADSALALRARVPAAQAEQTATLQLITDSTHGAVSVFRNYDSYKVPYRIPTLSLTRRGQLLTLVDRRYCWSDIGFGRVDIVMKTSNDLGATWGPDSVVLRGGGTGVRTGYGDPCLVADRTSDEALLVCVAGDVPYYRSTLAHPQHIVRSHGKYDPQRQAWTWGPAVDMTEHIYHELLGDRVNGLFMSSGRILQSRRVKLDRYYRLYAALCTHRGNFVLYSDDFGRKWSVLGSDSVSCVPKGDEAKCEELPDGSVVISSRKNGGRWWNVFHFTNPLTADGRWDEPVDSRTVEGGISNTGNPTNGEVFLVEALDQTSGEPCHLLLQSVPAGPNRHNVSIYYKALRHRSDYATSAAVAGGWEGSYLVSPRGSAYSTMEQLPDGRIGFFFEEEPTYFQLIYQPLDIKTITGGKYAAKPLKKSGK